MLKKINSYLKYKIPSSRYRKIYSLYALFTLITITSTSACMIYYYNKDFSTEIAKSDKRLLMQTRISSDTLIRDNIQSLALGKFHDVSRDKNIFDFFYGSTVNNENALYQAYKTISNITLDNSFIDSIYIYRKSDNTVISSLEGLISPYTSYDIFSKGYIYKMLIKKCISSSQSQFWVSPTENSAYWPKKKVISYVLSIPFSPQAENIGCLVININEELFFETVNSISDKNTGQLVVIDSNGRIFSGNDPSNIFKTEEKKFQLNGILDGDEGFIAYKVKDRTYGISWVKSSVTDWRYVSITPIEALNKGLLASRQFAILIMAFAVFLSLILLKLITSYIHKPFKQFFSSLVRKLSVQPEDGSDDIALANRLFDNLSDEIKEMSEIIQQNQSLIEYKIVMDLIFNKCNFCIEDINKRLELVSKSFNHTGFYIIVTEICNNEFMRLSAEQHEYVLYKTVEIINTCLSDNCTCLSIPIQQNQVVSIVNNNNDKDLSVQLSLLLEQLKDNPGINCNMALSNCTNDISNLYCAFSEVTGYLNYRLIFKYGNIFTYARIQNLDKNPSSFDLSIIDNLVPMFRTCKVESLKEEINKVISLLESGDYSYNDVVNILSSLTNIFCRVVKEQNINSEVFSGNKIIAELDNILFLDEYKEHILKLIDTYSENIHVRNNSIDNEFIQKVMNYTIEHLDEQITLNIVADKFNISPNYLSRIFKENTGINFSYFIIDEKMKKARELLLSGNNMTISEISKRVGYYNTPYFVSIFKEKYGLTPSKFKKCNINNT
jgi:AraC-type DNA-binding domain-containing proteins